MKRFIILLLIVLISAALFACDSEEQSSTDAELTQSGIIQDENNPQTSGSDVTDAPITTTKTDDEGKAPVTDGTQAPSTPLPSTPVSSCEHMFTDPSCRYASFCKICGYSNGQYGDHAWKGPFCNMPRHCGTCGYSDSEELGDHLWGDANCTYAKTCVYCNMTEGEPNGEHIYSYAPCLDCEMCMLCFETKGEPKGKHDWADATCQTPKHCTMCLMTEGEPTGIHVWVEANCGVPKHCMTCSLSEGEPVGEHVWIDATCSKPRICGVCSKSEGEPTGIHVWVEANCTYAKFCIHCGHSEGEPNGEHVWKEADCAPKRCLVCSLRVGESAGLEHNWTGGSCRVKQRCSECNEVGDYKHEYNEQFKCTLCKYYEFSYGLEYKPYGDGYAVVGRGSCTDSHVKIPETYNGKPVVSIGKKAFFLYEAASEITIPKTVTHIGLQAIFDTQKIYYQSTLEDWIAITKDEDYSENNSYRYIPMAILGNFTLYIDGKPLYTLVIPESVTEIPSSAFASLYLKEIILHDKVTKIGKCAFYDVVFPNFAASEDEEKCIRVDIPDSVKEICDYAFEDASVKSFVIPEGIEKIGYTAFFRFSAVYCKEEAKPELWDEHWKGIEYLYVDGEYIPVSHIYWKDEWEYVDGVPQPIS